MRARAFAALLLLLAPLVLSARVRQPNAAPIPLNLRASARQAASADVPRVPPQFNINSGGPPVGRFIDESVTWIVGTTGVFVKDDAIIGGAEEKNLPMYKSHRFGADASAWGYDIPVMEPGTYGCTVHFAETHSDSFTEGRRVFDLYIATAHGEPRVFEGIDIIEQTGGAEFTVLTKTAVDLVITGILSIRVNPIIGDPIISGLTCERVADLPSGVEPDFDTDPNLPMIQLGSTGETTGPMPEPLSVPGTEININCGGEAIGRFTAEDFSWIRGTTSMWEGPPGVDIGGAEPKNAPAVKSHRYGVDGTAWGYVIPVDMPGVYDCSLHFSETDSAAATVGARVFDIMIMDRILERVDIYADAGPALFTSVVKTFTDLFVSENLMIAFKAVNGNAFISAITCEKTASLAPDGTPDASVSPDMTIEEPSPSLVVIPSIAPGPAPPSFTPMASPAVEPPIIESPSVEVSPASPTTEVTVTEDPVVDVSPTPSVVVPGSESSLLDEPLVPGDGSFVQSYELRAVVTEGGEFTEEIKDALITISKESTAQPSEFALVGLRREETRDLVISRVSVRQEGDAVSYEVDLQGLHEDEDQEAAVTAYATFINEEANDKLKEQNINNVEISMRQDPNLVATTETSETSENNASGVASTSNTAVIIGATVGCIMGALAIIAVVAFFVVNRKRNNEPGAAAFDAPPPAMSESELSSQIERSETGASVEYLDDDSTFTAATSRAGDPVDQVGFVKDMFGRGTADGAHGSA